MICECHPQRVRHGSSKSAKGRHVYFLPKCSVIIPLLKEYKTPRRFKPCQLDFDTPLSSSTTLPSPHLPSPSLPTPPIYAYNMPIHSYSCTISSYKPTGFVTSDNAYDEMLGLHHNAKL